MSDYIVSLQLLLLAYGHIKEEKSEKILLPSLVQELLDYVNSKEYQQLIIDERNKLKQPI